MSIKKKHGIPLKHIKETKINDNSTDEEKETDSKMMKKMKIKNKDEDSE